MEIESVYLDTSFFIRLLDESDKHHSHARGYFERFREKEIPMYTSTVVAAEYGVVENIDHLPVRFVQLQAFDIRHARQTATFAKICFEAKKKGVVVVEKRVVIPNDTKIIAQAHIAKASYLVGRDDNADKLLQFLNAQSLTACRFLDISTPPKEFWGELF